MDFAILGPDIVRHGVNPSTALIVSGDCAILGPASGPSEEVDPISRLFLGLGKIIAARRVATQDRVMDPRPPAAIETFGVLQAFTLDQTDDRDEYELIWAPLAADIDQYAIDPLRANVEDLDQRSRRFIAGETQAVLAINPRASVEERMESLDTYLRVKGFTVEQSSGGFRDFIAGAFVGMDGKRINLPTATDPSFPDSWITPTLVDPVEHGGSRRSWNIIW